MVRFQFAVTRRSIPSPQINGQPMFANVSVSVLVAIGIGILMAGTSIFIVFYHDRKHDQIDQSVDFSFSGTTLRQALGYYRFMAVSMLFFYVLFTCSAVYLQWEGHLIFKSEGTPQFASPIGTSLFTLDLVLRGGFFDVMEHFNIRLSPVLMNTASPWFVIYAFVFRMYYGLSLIKILLSFAWIYGKIRRARQSFDEPAA
ncbi:MAG: hypothetical protein AAFQ45_05540 [Pseudomonadota bacterium]